MLRDLLQRGVGARISFGRIVAALGRRGYGLSILIFALPSCLPMPPGIPTVTGLALIVIAVQLIVGGRRLWLPGPLARRTIARDDLARVVDRALPYVEKLERYTRPRFAVATERVGQLLIGLLLLILGILLVLPIPFVGNIPPAIAAVIIAVGLSERDGVMVVVGLFAGLVAAIIAGSAGWAVILGLLYVFN